jgi:hypothetical protein
MGVQKPGHESRLNRATLIHVSDFAAAQALLKNFEPQRLHRMLDQIATRWVAVHGRFGHSPHFSVYQAEWSGVMTQSKIAKLDAATALAASWALPENVNYAVKSSFLSGFLESVPAVSAKLKTPNTADQKFEDVVKSAQDAAVLVLVY